MPRGASAKREREYEEVKSELERDGRYAGREDQVAAHSVNKLRRPLDETHSKWPAEWEYVASDLPIAGYEYLNVPQVMRRLRWLSPSELRRIEQHERHNKNRASLLRTLGRALARH